MKRARRGAFQIPASLPPPMRFLALWLGIAALCSPDALRDRIRRLAAPAGGRVGAAALLVETGERVLWNGTERFPMQSVYKLPIAMEGPAAGGPRNSLS